MKGFIYANVDLGYRVAKGYLDWYEKQYRFVATDMLQNQMDPDKLLEVMTELEEKRFKFANRIRKTHHVNIPVDIIYMKLKGFIREIADEIIRKEHAPEQLEFDFGEEK